jgi:hypothetical protein
MLAPNPRCLVKKHTSPTASPESIRPHFHASKPKKNRKTETDVCVFSATFLKTRAQPRYGCARCSVQNNARQYFIALKRGCNTVDISVRGRTLNNATALARGKHLKTQIYPTFTECRVSPKRTRNIPNIRDTLRMRNEKISQKSHMFLEPRTFLK